MLIYKDPEVPLPFTGMPEILWALSVSSSVNLISECCLYCKEVELADTWVNLESGNKDMLLSHNGADC